MEFSVICVGLVPAEGRVVTTTICRNMLRLAFRRRRMVKG